MHCSRVRSHADHEIGPSALQIDAGVPSAHGVAMSGYGVGPSALHDVAVVQAAHSVAIGVHEGGPSALLWRTAALTTPGFSCRIQDQLPPLPSAPPRSTNNLSIDRRLSCRTNDEKTSKPPKKDPGVMPERSARSLLPQHLHALQTALKEGLVVLHGRGVAYRIGEELAIGAQ